ncbi:diguanylate cyclase [Thermomonas sp. HDW16]|uniref:GGDEF domain-containing protein n=1 Tax=Thermomonas sp. HDW16 TaxID=2714945 RepID=UPI001F10D665|nr:diguanylate cyclase [Thermomonas sp. HDW16]
MAAIAQDVAGAFVQGDPHSPVLTAAEYALFAQVARTRRADTGHPLFRRGDLGTSMFVIASGAVDLDFGDDLVGKRLGAREFFGELGLLIGDHARSAEATMVESGVLLELGRDEFDALAARDPQLLAQFLRRAIMRVVSNEQALIGRLRRRNQELQTALDTLRATAHRLNQTEVLTRTDELTGLSNRRGFGTHVQQRRRNGALSGLSLILIDCDRFKHVNDAHGHLAGDRVLQSVANLLRAVAGPDDVACRLGGDEFCLLVQGHQHQELERTADYILGSARALTRMHHNPPQMTTLSLGICTVGESPQDWEHWYTQADTALYRAKRLGGDRVEWQD